MKDFPLFGSIVPITDEINFNSSIKIDTPTKTDEHQISRAFKSILQTIFMLSSSRPSKAPSIIRILGLPIIAIAICSILRLPVLSLLAIDFLSVTRLKLSIIESISYWLNTPLMLPKYSRCSWTVSDSKRLIFYGAYPISPLGYCPQTLDMSTPSR